MAELLRVSIVGTLPSGEEWSVNPVWSIGGDFGTPVTAAQALTIANAITAIAVPTSLRQMLSTSSAVTGCRVEARSIAGVLETQAESNISGGAAGMGISAHPFQTSAVFSLRTATPGGRGRGRLYWPATGIAVQAASLRVSSGDVTSSLSGAKTYLSGIEGAIEATLSGVALAVWSRAGSDLHLVNSIHMGDVLDTQRRRRDALVEGYQTTSYP